MTPGRALYDLLSALAEHGITARGMTVTRLAEPCSPTGATRSATGPGSSGGALACPRPDVPCTRFTPPPTPAAQRGG